MGDDWRGTGQGSRERGGHVEFDWQLNETYIMVKETDLLHDRSPVVCGTIFSRITSECLQCLEHDSKLGGISSADLDRFPLPRNRTCMHSGYASHRA